MDVSMSGEKYTSVERGWYSHGGHAVLKKSFCECRKMGASAKNDNDALSHQGQSDFDCGVNDRRDLKITREEVLCARHNGPVVRE